MALLWDQRSGYDHFPRVGALRLGEECAAELARDLIRQRGWDYSALAVSPEPEGTASPGDPAI